MPNKLLVNFMFTLFICVTPVSIAATALEPVQNSTEIEGIPFGDKTTKPSNSDATVKTVKKYLPILQSDTKATQDNGLCEKFYKAKSYAEAYPYCLKAAESGDAESQNILGEMYEEGKGVEQEYSTALAWYCKAVAKDYAKAQYNLGSLYYYGKGMTKDATEAAKWMRKAAEQGYSHAQTDLAFLYFTGDDGISQNYEEAKYWYTKAALQEDPDAYNALGVLYAKGLGVKQDYKEALIWLRKAADNGIIGAQTLIGSFYYQGNGVQQDYKEAVVWLRKAAEQGDSKAQSELGSAYIYGNGVHVNYAEALKWFKLSAEQDLGDAEAQNWLGDAYYNGNFGVTKNLSEAEKWYRLAARSFYVSAISSLCRLYFDGDLAQDYNQQEKWCGTAAVMGDQTAQALLGEMNYHGLGVKKDFATALHWYRKSAEQGNKFAQKRLGSMYEGGIGVPKNFAEAAQWYQKSAEQGDSESQVSLANAYLLGNGVKKDNIEALAWFNIAAAKDKNAIEPRNTLEKGLNAQEIELAQRLSLALQTKIDENNKSKYKANLAKNNSVNANSKSRPVISKILLPSQTTTVFSSNDVAVIIGIEKYRSVPSTEYVSADAGMVRDYLKALGIQERNIEFLADDRATLSDIRKVIETKLPNMVKDNSRVIVYYAGHGAPDAATDESYLVPYDGDPSFLADTAYPLSRLYDRLSRLKTQEVLVLLDSCFSGAGGRSVLAKGARPLVMVKETAPPASKKMIVVTSSRGSQITTSLPEVGHGAFTYFFLRALQEGSRDIGEVYAYLERRVADEAKRQNVDQTPTISPSADKLKGRFLFAK